jgi:hypothetical protein
MPAAERKPLKERFKPSGDDRFWDWASEERVAAMLKMTEAFS